MANIAQPDAEDQDDPLCQIRRSLLDAGQTGQPQDEGRQTEQANDDISTVDDQATNPLPKVVPLGFEDEMLVPKKREGNTDQAGEWAGDKVGVRQMVRQGPLEKRETAIAKEGIDDPYGQILQPVAR